MKTENCRDDRLAGDILEEAVELGLDLYRRLPEVQITDILVKLDLATAFTYLRTAATRLSIKMPPNQLLKARPDKKTSRSRYVKLDGSNGLGLASNGRLIWARNAEPTPA